MRTPLSFFFLLLGLSCFGQVKSDSFQMMLQHLLQHSVPEVSVQPAFQNRASLLFLDARETKEYTVSHLAGAQHIGYDHFDIQSLATTKKDQPIVVYCSVGYRSEKIAEKLRSAGYSNVSNLYGGIFEWVNEGLPLVNDHGATTKVHAYSRTWGIWLKRGEKVY